VLRRVGDIAFGHFKTPLKSCAIGIIAIL